MLCLYHPARRCIGGNGGPVCAGKKSKGRYDALRDAGPDYWGRCIIEKHTGKAQLGELDYLLESPDDRAGALGFGLNKVPPAPHRKFNKSLDLEKLQNLADALVKDDLPNDAAYLRKNVAGRNHQQALDTATPVGRAMFNMCGVFAEFERSMIQERVKAGLARARAQDKRLGRPAHRVKMELRIQKLYTKGMGKVRIGTTLGIGTSAVQRVLGHL